MRLNPDARDLLATALETFRAEILPAVPQEKRYTALMIANALAMVEREFVQETESRELQAAAAALYGEAPPPAGELVRRLAAEIEAGLFDAPGLKRDAAFHCLKALNAAQLAITNPKLLAGTDPR